MKSYLLNCFWCVILFVSCSNISYNSLRAKKNAKPPLEVKIKLNNNKINRGIQTLIIETTLINNHYPSFFLENSQLQLGYKGDFGTGFYFEIKKNGEGYPVPDDIDYQYRLDENNIGRMFNANDSAITNLNLLSLYSLDQTGKYLVRAVFNPQGVEPKYKPVFSNWIEIIVE